MIINGDSLHKLKKLAENSIDAVVTDPPYGLSFMNKHWDYSVPSVELWREVLRVLKPGGHLLSFGGTRTYHRLAVNIEDAGFEIRDQIQWLYGSGFPKSTDVSKRIDKEAGAKRDKKDMTQIEGSRMIAQSIHAACNICGLRQFSANACKCPDPSKNAITDAAKQWQGWGTALKPANEPIVVARKPLEKGLTVAENVQKWGCGAINIDASRIEGEKRSPEFKSPKSELGYHGGSANANLVGWDKSQGRWPANIILDETAAEILDAQSGVLTSGARNGKRNQPKTKNAFGKFELKDELPSKASSGGASRFFYVAKASKRERGEDNVHPTVKPIKLMEYLIKLVTPPNGTVLDPFMGSGSTGVAAKNLGFGFVGIELSKEYYEIAKRRINSKKREKQLELEAIL